MSTHSKTVGVTLATAAAALFIAGTAMTVAPPAAKAEGVKCSGINSCKGLNACKGHGFIIVDSAGDCTSKGGTVEK